MKVEVIKDVSHSVELILGEISVCITPDEAENLIAQLRAVVPVPEDVQEAAEITHDEGVELADGYQYYLATGLTEGWERPIGPKWMMKFAKKRFIAGAEWQRERLMKDAVEIDTDITINGYTKRHVLHISSTDEHIQHLPQGEYKAIIIKKEK